MGGRQDQLEEGAWEALDHVASSVYHLSEQIPQIISVTCSSFPHFCLSMLTRNLIACRALEFRIGFFETGNNVYG